MNELNKEFLKKLGFTESSLWMTMYNPSCTEFFQWLQENISDQNILSLEELKQYEELQKTNQLLPDDEVDQLLAEMESQYPMINEDLDVKIETTKQELAKVQALENKYTKLEKTAIELQKQAEEEAFNAKSQHLQNTIEFTTAVEKCISVARNLEEIERENTKLTNELVKVYTESPKRPVFMFQVPLFNLRKNSFDFRSELKTYLDADPVLQPSKKVELFDVDISKITAARDGLIKAQRKSLDTTLDILALKKTEDLKYIPIPKTFDELDSALLDYEAENMRFETYFENLLDDVHNDMEKVSFLKIETILKEMTHEKCQRAEERTKRLRALNDLVTEFTTAIEIIWITLKLEKDKISFGKSHQDECGIKGTKKRISLMQRVSNQMPDKATERQLVKIFQDSMGSDTSEMAELVLEFNEIVKIFHTTTNSLASDVPVNSVKELDEIESNLKKLLYCGPTGQINVVNPKLFALLQTAEKEVQQNNEENLRLSAQYKNQYQEPRERDRYLKISSRLWSWFLTEPKQVIEAIRQISEAVAKLSTDKVISGIRRMP